MKPFSFFPVFLLFVIGAGALAAQDFYGSGVSARSAGRAGIYVPSSDDVVDALTMNPAGLTVLGAPTVNLTVEGMWAQGSFTNATNVESGMRRTVGAVPFGAFGMPVGHSRWSVGAGVTPDLLSSSNWEYNDAPGGAGKANYGLQAEKSSILALRSSVGVGYLISPRLSVGATVGADYNSNTLHAPYIFQSNPALQGLKTLLDLHTSGVGWNGSFGFLARPSRRIELGASYKTHTSIVSSGRATGDMGAQFAALGIPFKPDFGYRARVNVELPQSALASILWQVNPRLRLSLQGDWTDWNNAFRELPVHLTQGTNTDINNFLGSNGINDTVPLSWKDQFTFRAGVERVLGESFSVSGGFVHGNDPVPNSTLSPLTAAIMQNGLATGLGYHVGRCRFDVSYGIDLTRQAQVGTSTLLAGEYGNSRVRVGMQTVKLSTSFRL